MMTWKIFRHKGLKRLTRLISGLPGYRLHALRGEPKSYWSVTISCNWRVLFRFFDGNALEVVEKRGLTKLTSFFAIASV